MVSRYSRKLTNKNREEQNEQMNDVLKSYTITRETALHLNLILPAVW